MLAQKTIKKLLLLALMLAVVVGIYLFPPVHTRLSWRFASWRAQVLRLINPPQAVVFIPQGENQAAPGAHASDSYFPTPVISATSTTDALTVSQTPSPVVQEPEPTSTPVAVSTASPTPIPPERLLTGIVHEYQQFNNCGPANLAMALSFWRWTGNQNDTRAYLRPNRQVDDKNVMPEEMAAFVAQNTSLQAVVRVGGDLDLLKRFLAAGFPVLIEKGHHPPDDWWMGHYVLVNGYDDQKQQFTIQDSLIAPDLPLAYGDLAEREWRDFNYVYLVIYAQDQADLVENLLGAHSDLVYNYRAAEQKALQEIPLLSDRDLFFAWFNLGSSRVGLADFAGAAEAYDQAFQMYQALSEAQRPYRLMWYQSGPYTAYYQVGRYQDVINLANTTFTWAGQPVLEESYYWRELAYARMGETNQAIKDLTKAAELNPNYALPRLELQRLGVEIP